MIVVRTTGGQYEFEVWAEPPCIYLDHWALRRLSEDRAVGSRVISAFKHRGTLMFSVMNVAEIARTGLSESRQQVRDFLEEFGPHWFPMTIAPSRIIQAEEEERPPKDLDCADVEFLTDPHFATRLIAGPVSLGHVVDLTHGSGGDDLRKVTECKTTELLEEFQRWRSLYASNPEALDTGFPLLKFDAKKAMRGIYYGLARYTIKDNFPLDGNHVRDFCHATVSVRCADMVTLDQHWAGQVQKLKLPKTFVQVYSEPDLSKFLSDLEAAPWTR